LKISKRSGTIETLCVIPARMTSNRFPGKALVEIRGKPMIQHVIERCSQSLFVDKVVVAIPNNKGNKPLAVWLRKHKADYMAPKGISENNVLGRIAAVVDKYNPALVVRVNGDSPLVMPDLIDRAVRDIKMFRKAGPANQNTCVYLGYKFGQTPSVMTRYAAPEVFTANALRLWASAIEHVTPNGYIETLGMFIEMEGTPFPTVVDTPSDVAKVAFRMEEPCSS